jgi:hypothetical protein
VFPASGDSGTIIKGQFSCGKNRKKRSQKTLQIFLQLLGSGIVFREGEILGELVSASGIHWLGIGLAAMLYILNIPRLR